MKTLSKIFMLHCFFISQFWLSVNCFAQEHKQPAVNFSEENINIKVIDSPVIKPLSNKIKQEKNNFSQFTFEMHEITDLKSSFDMQSNASPQQLYYDFTTNSLNAVFTTSQLPPDWPDRTCTYFCSFDEGVSWTNVGNVPDPTEARSGYPAILGLSSGNIIIANHSGFGGGEVRTQLFVNSGAGQFDFTNYDPGVTPEGNPIWPRLGKSLNDLVQLRAFSSGSNYSFDNTFDLSKGEFAGYSYSQVGRYEGYSLATSDNGKIGIAYVDQMKAFLIESTDGGLTWPPPLTLFTPFEDTINGFPVIHGTFSGINLTYLGESPKVVFEVMSLPDNWGVYARMPSEIYFWSPDMNNGESVIIADSNNVPYYSSMDIGVDIVQSIARPVIGKAEGNAALFLAFYASTENIFHTYYTFDSIRVYGGFFMMSEDGGSSWSIPEMFTPDTTVPVLDWRWVSIAPVNPVEDNNVNVHLVIVGDPIAGAFVYPPSPILPTTAKFYHFSTIISLTDVEKEQNSVSTFKLYQNYPNPFNPSTKIKFSVPSVIASVAKQSDLVSLKVFDILGNEISTLVNNELTAGEYEVEFNATELTSGIYFYQLKTGSHNQTQKMILIK